MNEPIFNLYYIIENGVIRGRAAARHFHSGTDEEKLEYLQERCIVDAEMVIRHVLFGNRFPHVKVVLMQACNDLKCEEDE